MRGAASCILRYMGVPITVTRGATTVACIGYVRETQATERANDSDKAPAIFVLEFEPMKALGGVHKFDKIVAHGKTYTVIEARTCFQGSTPIVIRGTASA